MSEPTMKVFVADLLASMNLGALATEPAILRAGGIVNISSSSILIGSVVDNALAADRRVVTAMSQGGEQLLAALRASPLTGCTSIMSTALTQSGWNPADPGQVNDPSGLGRYQTALMQSDMFGVPPQVRSDRLNLLDYSNSEMMTRAIASLLPYVTTSDRNRVTRSILDTAHRVFDGGGDHGSGRATLFVQHALAIEPQRIEVHLHWCQAVMVLDRKKKKGTVTESRQSEFNVTRTTFSMRMDRWEDKASEIARQKITDVETWLKATSC